MPIRIRGPRLTLADVEALLAAHAKLVALDETLKRTQWAGAHACIVLAGEVDQVIARLYNKAEATFTRGAPAESTEKPQDEPPAIAAAEIPAEGDNIKPGEEEL